jgi:DNA-binding NtrC family response regulator
MKQFSIIIVDDSKSVLSALELLFNGRFQKIKTLSSPNQLLTELGRHHYDLLLLDMNFSSGINTGNEGLYWLQRVLERYPDMGVVMVTAYGDIELAVKAVRLGALDFITKPWENEKMLAVVESACRLTASRKNVDGWQSKGEQLSTSAPLPDVLFKGVSMAWKKVMAIVEKVASTDANVLITGENGTGKEIVASEIHRLSLRAGRQLVSVDMGSIVESLFESELFGHKKGAFTDAGCDRIGKIQEADGGTLFLDEIGNLPLSMQTKLLSVLQNRAVTRLGENIPISVNVRLICATNSPLIQRVEDGTFREDLLYRINTIHLELPPLRDRKDDIPGLAQFFLQKYTEKYNKQGMKLSEASLGILTDYNWPGNVRELQHAIEKAVILCDGNCISPTDFMFPRFDIDSGDIAYEGTLEDMEKKLITDAIKRFEGNMTAVASQLGITRQTLYNKIRRYGL